MNGTEIAAKLAQIRKDLGVPKTRIAALALCSRETVQRWEEGLYPAALDTAARWAKACGYELVIVPRAATNAPSELADLVALLHSAHTTPPDKKEN